MELNGIVGALVGGAAGGFAALKMEWGTDTEGMLSKLGTTGTAALAGFAGALGVMVVGGKAALVEATYTNAAIGAGVGAGVAMYMAEKK